MIRKTLTIVFADVQGYTSRTGRQTRQEHEQFIIELQAFIRKQTQENNGNFIKSMGDGFMLSFESPTDAVACGMDIQKQIALKNKGSDKHEHISFRIGISTGEVMVDDNGDAFGEAVNIAARIEKSARAGEVYISDATYLAMNKSEFNAVNLGPQKFKNVSHKTNVYRVVEGDIDLVTSLQRPIQKHHVHAASRIIAVLIIILIITLAVKKISFQPGPVAETEIYAQLEQLMLAGDFQAIIDTTDKILKKNPQRGDLYSFIGEAYLKLKDFKKAEDYLLNAIEFAPNNPGPYHILSDLYAAKKDYASAINYLAEYLTKDITSLEKKVAINRMQELEQFKKGVFSQRKQDRNQNLLILQVPTQIEQADPQQTYQDKSNILQTVYFSTEDEAIDLAKLEQSQNERQPLQHRDIGKMDNDFTLIKNQVQDYMDEGNYPPVRELLERSEKQNSDNPQYLMFSGRIYLKMDDYGKAEELFNKAKDIFADNPMPYLELSRLYEKTNDYYASIDMLEKFIALEQDNTRRQKAQHKLEFLRQKTR